MLSIQQCKKELRNAYYTDKQVEEIRESLYQLANIFVEEYLRSKKKNFNLTNEQAVTQK